MTGDPENTIREALVCARKAAVPTLANDGLAALDVLVSERAQLREAAKKDMAEIVRLNAIWNVQSFMLHAFNEITTDEERAKLYDKARKYAAEIEELRASRPMQVIQYLGSIARELARDAWAEPDDAALSDGPGADA